MSKSTLLPAIRSTVGDWIFYVTTLSFTDVAALLKDPDEFHERKKLSGWIQRKVMDDHSDKISKYILENEQRFLGSLIVGVYDGSPDWGPLNVKFSADHLNVSDEQKNNIEGKLGLLYLTGAEKLFAIDGQHRVEGIKKALKQPDAFTTIENDHVSAIFVAHDASSTSGIERTRRLFTTVNKKAKRISKAATIALDEDNGFAVVTRRLIDEHWLFEDDRMHISYTSSGAIPAKDEASITSVVGLYEIIKDLYPKTGQSKFESDRPSDQDIEAYLKICKTYFDLLLEKIAPYKEVFVKSEKIANHYREGANNHLLFRPVGQRAFAKATELLVSTGTSLEEAITILSRANMSLLSPDWHHIIWDPIEKKMIANKLVIAESQLLNLIGKPARNTKNAAKLNAVLESIATLKEE